MGPKPVQSSITPPVIVWLNSNSLYRYIMGAQRSRSAWNWNRRWVGSQNFQSLNRYSSATNYSISRKSGNTEFDHIADTLIQTFSVKGSVYSVT